MKRKVMRIVLATVLTLSLGLVLAGPVGASLPMQVDFESTGLTPGQSVEGSGTIHPQLSIQSSQTAQLIQESVITGWGYNTEPGIYNDGLGGSYGIADGEYGTYDNIEDYEFQFVGITVCYFAIEMYDYGDFFPFDTKNSMTHTVKLVAYDSLDNPIAESAPLTFKSTGSGNMYRTSGTTWDYGGTNLHVAGDAYGERDLNKSPGRWKFEVSECGIAKVKVVFDGDKSVDPGIGFDNIEFGERICDSICANEVVTSSQGKTFGGGDIRTDRSDPDNATGAPDRVMFSLGFNPPPNRYIVLDFGELVGGCLTVFENSPPLYQLADDPDYVNQETWDRDEPNSTGYPEENAEVWGSVSGEEDDWTFIGIATNKTLEIGSEGDDRHIHPNSFELDECIRYVKIVEISDEGNFVLGGHDGFDLDAVCAEPFVGPQEIGVSIDIKPTACPNPLNVKSKGVLPAAILGTGDFDVTQIDPASILLEGVAPLRWSLEDVATPYGDIPEGCEDCTTEGPDGYQDLTLKFDTQEVVAALGDVSDGDCKILQLTGNLKGEFGGTAIVGQDVVRIIKKGKK